MRRTHAHGRLRLLAAALAAAALSLVFAPTSLASNAGGTGVDALKFAGVQGVGGGGGEPFARCEGGTAAGYPCHNVDLMSHLSLADLGLTFVNDIWGWTDKQKRRDYALIGGTEGTVIVDITKPTEPDIVGTLPAHMLDPQAPFWRDIKVYRHYMYVVSEQHGHGLQVFDLKNVRGVKGPPVVFAETAHYDGFSTAHNLNINEDTGFLYAVGAHDLDGSFDCGGGLHMVNLSDPESPAFAGCFAEHGYIHDTQCVVYRKGPDRDYKNREICINSNGAADGDFLSITDVTNKMSPVAVVRQPYARNGHSHQGWLTGNQRYFLHGDELDELTHDLNTTTRVWDLSDLDNPVMTLEFDYGTTSIDHNIYIEGRWAYASNYTSGLRVLDVKRVGRPALTQVGFFDVYPENDNRSFEGGTWSNYPWFKRNKDIVAVSSMDRGLFVLRPNLKGKK